MAIDLSRGLMLALLAGGALVATPALANDFATEEALAAAQGPIGPGVSALTSAEVSFGPMDSGVVVTPDVSFGLPVVATIPDQGWAPIAPVTGIDARAH
jgi:hypothetical protein